MGSQRQIRAFELPRRHGPKLVATGKQLVLALRKVNHFLLEYDTPRAGDFAPLRFVPKGTGVVLGLISSKTPALESADLLKRRIDEASRSIDLDRLAVGPQCGFASTVAGNPLTEADERAKLRLAVQVAEQLWRI
jgi:5-methyltetrahydropteroyltriglutamate--homocysteine methyltransferase